MWWYAHGHLDHVPVIEDLAQVEAKINNLAADAPGCSSKLLFIFLDTATKFCPSQKTEKRVAT